MQVLRALPSRKFSAAWRTVEAGWEPLSPPGGGGRAALGAERFERQSPQDVADQGDGAPRPVPRAAVGLALRGEHVAASRQTAGRRGPG